MAIVTNNLVAEYVGKLAKTGTAPGNNTDPTETRGNIVGAASYDGTLSPDFALKRAGYCGGSEMPGGADAPRSDLPERAA